MTGELWPGLLAEAWAALSADSGKAADASLPAGLEVLRVGGAPGRLPSRLPAEDVAIACAGTALLAAAALHAQRGRDCGSRGSPIAWLDRGHIAAAFRSEAFLRVGGEPPDPASRRCHGSGGPPTAGCARTATTPGTARRCCARWAALATRTATRSRWRRRSRNWAPGRPRTW